MTDTFRRIGILLAIAGVLVGPIYDHDIIGSSLLLFAALCGFASVLTDDGLRR